MCPLYWVLLYVVSLPCILVYVDVGNSFVRLNWMNYNQWQVHVSLTDKTIEFNRPLCFFVSCISTVWLNSSLWTTRSVLFCWRFARRWLWIAFSCQQDAAKGGDDEDDDLEVSIASSYSSWAITFHICSLNDLINKLYMVSVSGWGRRWEGRRGQGRLWCRG